MSNEENLQISAGSTDSTGENVSVNSNPNSSTKNRIVSPKPCLFFSNGTCRNGNECRFSHDAAANAAAAAQPQIQPPPPIIINIPPGQPVFSIDVECVATGISHNARSIAQVALVDEWSRPIFNVYIKQDVPVVSHIEPLTGLSKEMLDQFGLPLGRQTVS